MLANSGELIRSIEFQPMAGNIDDEFARVDHVHDLSKDLLYKLSRNTDSNLIDNPEFIFSQRSWPAGLGVYAADRWRANGSGAVAATLSQTTSVVPAGTNITYSGSVTITTVDSSIAAGDYLDLDQGIEGTIFNEAKFGTASAQDLVLSFWARSSVAGTFAVALRNNTGLRSYVDTFTLEASTWKLIVFRIPGCKDGTWVTNAGLSALVSFVLVAGTTYQTTAKTWASGNYLGTSALTNTFSNTLSNVFYVTGVKLEIGNYTPYQRKPFQQDYLNCQRYLQVYSDPPLRGVISTATTAKRCGMPLMTEMRAAPTAAIYSGTPSMYDGAATGNVTSIGTQYNTTRSVEMDLDMSGGGFTVGRPAILYKFPAALWTFSAEI